MDSNKIAMNLSDGSGCFGRRVDGKPHLWWLCRVTTKSAPEYDQVVPPWARQQCERALAAGKWEIGGVITVVQP